jgi:N-acetylmuramoyl-L-alanine amidase
MNCKCNCHCKCKRKGKNTSVQPRISEAAIVSRPSPNFGSRNGESPTHLVMHYTAMNSAEDAIRVLCDANSANRVSAHYVVGNEATVYRLVPEDKAAWHAGISYWAGETGLNASSIGIEIDNPGDRPFTAPQMAAVTALAQDIISRHNISAHNVIGHSDIAPDRKQDPGHFFDWKGLAANGVGTWPTPSAQDFEKSKSWSDKQVRAALSEYGYSPKPALDVVITAFQRRFQPEVFQTPDKIGTADAQTKAILACLVRHQLALTSKTRRCSCKKK